MNNSKSISIATLLATIILICGCTTASKPKIKELSFNDQALIERKLNKLTIMAHEKAADNESIGAFNWGAFDDKDREIIKQSIFESFNKNAKLKDSEFNIFVQIHRYAQTITNASYASFVVVDWCIAEGNAVMFDEVFYAGHSSELLLLTGKSLGWAKSETHKAIINRILNRAIEYASNGKVISPFVEDNVYLDPEVAVSKLPKELTSSGATGFGPGYYYSISPQTGKTNFDKKTAFTKVAWEKKIKDIK